MKSRRCWLSAFLRRCRLGRIACGCEGVSVGFSVTEGGLTVQPSRQDPWKRPTPTTPDDAPTAE
jgi:hypothetical protein